MNCEVCEASHGLCGDCLNKRIQDERAKFLVNQAKSRIGKGYYVTFGYGQPNQGKFTFILGDTIQVLDECNRRYQRNWSSMYLPESWILDGETTTQEIKWNLLEIDRCKE